jgi:hypothetical protein
VTPPPTNDGALNVIISGPLRSATDHKTVVGKVTNTGMTTFTICGTDITWTVPVGSVTQDTGCATLGPGASKRFRNTWSYDAQVVAGQSYTVTGSALTGPLAGDPTPGDNTDMETRTAK